MAASGCSNGRLGFDPHPPPGGPALLFEKPKGYTTPVPINSFASMRKMEIALEVASVEEVAARIVEFLEMRMPEGLIGKLKMPPKLADMGAFFPKTVSKGACQTYRVPCITTMSGARAAAAAIAARVRDPIRVWSLQEIHAKTVV